jgi:hypothetical protein
LKLLIADSPYPFAFEEPFFVKKADDSKLFLEKHGFPKAFKECSGEA